MVGGTGTGMRLTVRFEKHGCVMVVYQLIQDIKLLLLQMVVLDIQTGDILTFSNIGSYNLSAESTEFELRVNTTSYGSNIQDSAGYSHQHIIT